MLQSLAGRRVLLVSCLALALVPGLARAGVSEWVDVDVSKGWIVIPVEIEGHPGTAIIDSGAVVNLISGETAARLDLKHMRGWSVDAKGVYESGEMPFVKNIPVRLFGVDFVMDRLPAAPPFGHDLLLSLEFLERAVFQIDYPNHRMRLMTADSVDLRRTKNVVLKRFPDTGGLLWVQVAIEDDNDLRWVLLDTGNNGCLMLHPDVLDSLTHVPDAAGVQGAGLFGTREVRTAVLPRLRIGPYLLEDVPVAAPVADDHNIRHSGILGYEILRHFVVTLNVRLGQLHLGLPES